MESTNSTPATKSRVCEPYPLSPAWRHLYQLLPDKRSRDALVRFMHFADVSGVRPAEVTDALLDAYAAHLTDSGATHVRRRERETTCFWNRMGRSQLGWPDVLLTERSFARPLEHRRWDELPDSFREDAAKYLHWLSGQDIFDEFGPARACKPRTVRQRRELIRIAASHLLATGMADGALTSLHVLVSPANVKALLLNALAKHNNQRTTFLRSLATELVSIAARYQKVSPTDLAELKRLRGRLGGSPAGMTPKNQTLLQQLEDERLLVRLLQLPEKLAESVRTQPQLHTTKRLQRMQTAVAIAILQSAPIRLQNLAAIQLGVHLSTNMTGDQQLHLSFAAEEVKNGQPLLLPLSGVTCELLDEYLNRYRPAGHESSLLFINADGSPKTADALRDGMQKAIRRELGIKMTPHQFRHLAGELILRYHPGAYALVQQLLGHSSIRTTMNFYTANQSRMAGRALDQILTKRRRGS